MSGADKEVWGLTGGVGAGKSAAGKIFRELGIPVVDADQIARELLAPGGAARDAVLHEFGTVERPELRKKVFGDEVARRALETILHPLIQMESRSRISQASGPCAIYEAALLVETGRYRDFSGLIVIDAPRELRKERLIARDGISGELAEKILDSQISDPARLAAANVVIPNLGALEDLRRGVSEFISERGWAPSLS